MKNFILTFLILFPLIGFGQEIPKEITDLVAEGYCYCIKEKNSSEKDILKNCLAEELYKNTENFIPFIEPQSEITDYEQGLEFGKKISVVIIEQMINDCDEFYNLSLNNFDIIFNDNKIKMLELNFERINNATITSLSNSNLSARGIYYFFTENYQNAEIDLNKAIELKKDDVNSLFILGWIKEKQGKYIEAIKIYENLYNSTKYLDYLVKYHIAKRKLKESHSN